MSLFLLTQGNLMKAAKAKLAYARQVRDSCLLPLPKEWLLPPLLLIEGGFLPRKTSVSTALDCSEALRISKPCKCISIQQ